jgi:hypothetical protein
LSVQEKEEEEARRVQEIQEVLGRGRSRRAGVASIKRKYRLAGPEGGLREEGSGANYVDRAGARRLLLGSDCPGEKTEQASLDTALAGTNKGHQMMEKMGWRPGGGLGAQGEGRAEPVRVELRAQGAGLGLAMAAPLPPALPGQKQKTDIWLKTQKRFKEAPLIDAFSNDDPEESTEPPAPVPIHPYLPTKP